MKSKEEKYREAVERNLFNAKRRITEHADRLWTRTILGIRKDDISYDDRIAELNAEAAKIKVEK